MIFAAAFFGIFTAVYAAGIAACIYQEEELSLPHERAIRMTIVVVCISVVLWLIALWSLISVNWDHLISLSQQ